MGQLNAMHFAFTDEQAMIAGTVKELFAAEATSERTRAAMGDGAGIDRALWARLGELGLAGVALPESEGGAGLGMVELAILAEAAGRHIAAVPLLASTVLAGAALAAGGSAEWLPAIASGSTIAALATASDPDRPGAGVTLVNERLDGTVTAVAHGEIADLFLVAAGGELALVARDTPGLTVTPQVTMDQTRPLARIELRGVEPLALLPEPARALEAARIAGCIAIAADCLGGAQACLDRTVDYAGDRVQFGRTIGSFQAVKHRLADMMVEIEQARSAVYWAACAVDEGAADAAIAVHAAKAFTSETYAACAGAMIQLHGGIGFTWEHDAHLYFKRARANLTLLGTPDWHREWIVRLIGLEAIAA